MELNATIHRRRIGCVQSFWGAIVNDDTSPKPQWRIIDLPSGTSRSDAERIGHHIIKMGGAYIEIAESQHGADSIQWADGPSVDEVKTLIPKPN